MNAAQETKQEIIHDVVSLAKTVVENTPTPNEPLAWYYIVALIATPIAVLSGVLLTWFKFFKKGK